MVTLVEPEVKQGQGIASVIARDAHDVRTPVRRGASNRTLSTAGCIPSASGVGIAS